MSARFHFLLEDLLFYCLCKSYKEVYFNIFDNGSHKKLELLFNLNFPGSFV